MDPAINSAPAVLELVIPIVAIVMGLGVAMLKLWFDFRKKREILQSYHAERMAAIEKGIDLPPLPPGFLTNGSPASPPEVLPESLRGKHIGLQYLRTGLTWLLIGIAISVALHAEHGNREWLWGGVPAAYGLSRLLFYFIANRMNTGATGPNGPGASTSPKE